MREVDNKYLYICLSSNILSDSDLDNTEEIKTIEKWVQLQTSIVERLHPNEELR